VSAGVRGFLLDTNVISEFGRERPSASVISCLSQLELNSLFVPDVVLAEVRFGITLLKDEPRRMHYDRALRDYIRPMFHDRVLSAGEETWLIWKRLDRAGRARRYTFPQPDLVIAALAEEHDLTVLTRDIAPFQEAGVAFLNPWES
jgi:toxin FitB